MHGIGLLKRKVLQLVSEVQTLSEERLKPFWPTGFAQSLLFRHQGLANALDVERCQPQRLFTMKSSNIRDLESASVNDNACSR